MASNFHPIAFFITSHEKEVDFSNFYSGLVELAEKLEIEFEPEYVMQDACNASYNAAKKLFPNINILMCYFHVVKNCKDERNLIPSEHHGFIFKKVLKRLHMTTSPEHFMKYYKQFVSFCTEHCLEFAKYLFKSWLSSKRSTNIFY